MKYVAVTDPAEAARIEQDIYKYMSTVVVVDGKAVRVLAQANGNVYYQDFAEGV